jgi:hypothetical protein
VTIANAFDVVSGALGMGGTFVLFKGSLRLALGLIFAGLFLQIAAKLVE